MAPKKKASPLDEMDLDGGSELDSAIDGLRGVLDKDASGGLPDLDTDFGGDFTGGDAGGPDLSAFGGDFGSDSDTSTDFGGGTDFGGSSDFGGGASFGGGSDFGGDDFSSPGREPGSGMHANLDLIMDIPIEVQIVLGTSRMQVAGLMNLAEGAIIALDRRIGEPVDVIVNGRLIGRGEITVLEEDDTRFGVKMIEVKSTK